MNMDKKIEELSFEETMKKLDLIVEELNREGATLEDSLKAYEEGVALVRSCNAKLEDTQRRIKMLQISQNGEITEADFKSE